MNYQYESQVVIDAAACLSDKINICEVQPTVRFSTTKHGESFVLVCQHPDSSINCGTQAERCTSCLDKNKARKQSSMSISYMTNGIIK